MISFNCPPVSGSPLAPPLVFDWDESSGTVSGPSADYIRRIASDRFVSAHPYPSSHEFSAEPLKSRVDMAAIIGEYHRLPEELAGAYPTHEAEDLPGDADGTLRDDHGNIIGYWQY